MDLNDGGAASGASDVNVGGVADLMGGGSAADAGGGDGGQQQGGVDGNQDGGPQQQGGADPDWYGQLSSETGEGQTASNLDVAKAKGWKTLDDVLKGYREAERAVRDGGRVKVPGEGASDEEVAAFRAAIGVPEKPEGYAIPQPKDADGNDIPINSALTERVVASAHKHGVPKAALDAILADEISAQIAEYDELVKGLQVKAGEHVKSWGEDRDAKLANVNAAAQDIGLTREDMEYLRGMPSGPGKALDMLAKFGSNFSEDSMISGDRRTFGMNAAQAQAEIDAIKADPATFDKAMVPGSAENKRYNRAVEALGAAADKAMAAN